MRCLKIRTFARPLPCNAAFSKCRISDLTLYLRLCSECEPELDDGIDAATARFGVAAGANVLVAGTSIFGDSEGVAAAMIRLRAATGKPINPEKGSLCA